MLCPNTTKQESKIYKESHIQRNKRAVRDAQQSKKQVSIEIFYKRVKIEQVALSSKYLAEKDNTAHVWGKKISCSLKGLLSTGPTSSSLTHFKLYQQATVSSASFSGDFTAGL